MKKRSLPFLWGKHFLSQSASSGQEVLGTTLQTKPSEHLSFSLEQESPFFNSAKCEHSYMNIFSKIAKMCLSCDSFFCAQDARDNFCLK